MKRMVNVLTFLSVILTCFLSQSLTAEEKQQSLQYEQRVYVPYEELNSVLKKEGQSIFVPYSDFVKLWEKAYKNANQEVPPPPIDGAIIDASYKGEEQDRYIDFSGTLSFKNLITNNWARIPLNYAGIGITKASIGEKEAFLALDQHNRPFLLHKGEGIHQLKLDFKVNILESPGKRQIQIRFPESPKTKLSFKLKGTNLEVKSLLNTPLTIKEEDDHTIIETYLDAQGNLNLQWLAKTTKRVEKEAMLFSKSLHSFDVEEGILKGTHQFNLQITQSKLDTISMSVPSNVSLVNVNCPNLKEWDYNKEGFLTLSLFEKTKGHLRVSIETEKLLKSGSLDFQLPNIQVNKSSRDEGIIQLFNSKELKLKVTQQEKLTQNDKNPIIQGNKLFFASYKYLSQPYKLFIKKETILPKLKTEYHSLFFIDERIIDLYTVLKLNIENAGIFEFKLKLPKDFKLAEILDESLIEDYQIINGEKRELKIQLKRKYIGEISIPLHFEYTSKESLNSFTFPKIEVFDAVKTKGSIQLWSPQKLKISSKNLKGLRSINRTSHPLLDPYIKENFFFVSGLKFANNQFEGMTEVEKRSSRLSVGTERTVFIEENSIKNKEKFNLNIEFAPIREIQIDVPISVSKDIVITGTNIKEKKYKQLDNSEFGRWTLLLHDNLIGAYSFDVAFEQKISSIKVGETIEVGTLPIKVVNSFKQNGFVGIVKNKNIQIENSGNSQGIDDISIKDLPHRLKGVNPTLAFKYQSPLYQLNLNIQKFEYASVLPALIELAHFDMVASLDGKLRTEAVFSLKNTNIQMIELKFPHKDATIISAFISGNKVNLSKGNKANTKLIILPKLNQNNKAITLRVTYQVPLKGPFSSFGQFNISPIQVIDIPVTQQTLRLWVPKRNHYYSFEGDLNRNRPISFWDILFKLRANIQRPVSRLNFNHLNEILPLSDEFNKSFSKSDLVREGKMYTFRKLDGNGSLKIKYLKSKIYKRILFSIFVVLLIIFIKIPRSPEIPNYKISLFFLLTSILLYLGISYELRAIALVAFYFSILSFMISYIEKRIKVSKIRQSIENNRNQ